MLESIDINCDMGESFGNWKMGDDAGMMPYITTANVACGFHAGDPLTMLNTVRLAKRHDVVVGAHPGLPDLLGFGRRAMNITPEDAYSYIVYQVGALQASLVTEGMALHHVKPHGAFYSVLKANEELADAVAEAMLKLGGKPLLYWPAPTSAALPTACKRRGIAVVGEIYPDLEYAADGSLVIQRHKHTTDVAFACAQVERYVTTGKVQAVDGTLVELDAVALCIHGDGPNCTEVGAAIRQRLQDIGCAVKPFML